MRIEGSFIRSPLTWKVPAAFFWSLALVLVAAAVSTAHAIVQLREAEPSDEKRLERARERLESLQPLELPSRTEIDALRKQIAGWNRVSGIKGWGTAQLLAWLEGHTPADVYFVSFQHEPKDGEVKIVASSSKSASLTGFLRMLEGESAFSEVLLSKQGGKGASGGGSQFEIQIKLTP